MTKRGRYLRHFPEPLLDELVAGRWLPIVGSGLSRNAVVPYGRSIPLWDELGRTVAADIPDHAYVGAIDGLSAFEHEFGRRQLVNRLYRDLLVDEAEPGDAHRAFCRLRFDRVVTTNFEFLLERGYDTVGERCDVVIDEEQLPIPPRRDAIVLLKLHGDLRHPGRMVVTEDDYDGFLNRYPVLATHVASLLINRVPVLIGYSFDDPDLRQLLAMLRDRLGPMLPNAYAIVVGADSSAIARYARRGIKVINLPGARDRYSEILTAVFEELGDLWHARVLEQVQFTEERPLEEVETSPDRTSSRLCFFSIPLNLVPLYRDEIFPAAEVAGFVPVSGFDVTTESGNRLAAIRALLERSRVAVVDVSAGAGSTELIAATHALGSDNVLIIAGPRPPAWATASGAHVISREDEAVEPDTFMWEIFGWFEQRTLVEPDIGFEASELLKQKQWRAALIVAVADVEALLRPFAQEETFNRRATSRTQRVNLRRVLSDRNVPIDDDLRKSLIHALALRNATLHDDATVSSQDARGAVADVAKLRRALGR